MKLLVALMLVGVWFLSQTTQARSPILLRELSNAQHCMGLQACVIHIQVASPLSSSRDRWLGPRCEGPATEVNTLWIVEQTSRV